MRRSHSSPTLLRPSPGCSPSGSSDDGETWTFTVNTDRAFHDGHQLNAQDAAYTIRRPPWPRPSMPAA
ncbi:MAG: ABC transporter substrate-binding protein [Oscillospiraceae bacterium]